MRLIHAADIHLGFRQFLNKTTATGLYVREVDIAHTFRRVVDRWIDLRPDVICVAGDLFHHSHPPNAATVHAHAQFKRLRGELPNAIIAVVAGNHDVSSIAADGSVFPLLSSLGVYAIDSAAGRRLEFPDRDLAILCVPDKATVPLEPDPRFRLNVLVLHGGLEDVAPKAIRGTRKRLTAADLHAERWTYVALGDYHVFRSFAPNCCYTGSIDYTSTNIWGEVREERAAGLPGKCFVEFDLESGARTIHPIPGTRPVVDLDPIEAAGLEPAAVDAIVAQRFDGVVIDNAIVRLVVRDIPRSVEQGLDKTLLHAVRARAFDFQFATERPEREPMPILTNEELIGAVGAKMRGERVSVREIVARRLTEHTLPTDLNREDFVALGLHYLEQANDDESEAIAKAR